MPSLKKPQDTKRSTASQITAILNSNKLKLEAGTTVQFSERKTSCPHSGNAHYAYLIVDGSYYEFHQYEDQNGNTVKKFNKAAAPNGKNYQVFTVK